MLSSTSLFFVLSTIVLFFLDVAAYAFFHAPTVFFMRSLFYAELYAMRAWWRIFLTGFFVLLMSFLYCGCCGIDLIIMVPLTFLALYLRKSVHANTFIYAGLALISMLIHYLVIDYGLFGRSLEGVFSLKSVLIHYILILLCIRYFFAAPHVSRQRN